MKQMNRKPIKFLAILGLFLLAVISMTIAYYNSRKEFQNPFHTPKPGVAIHEKFNPSDWWVPGEEKSKKVWFSNTDDMDMLLRFRVDVKWIKKPKDQDGNDLPDSKIPADVVTLYWKDSTDGTPLVLPEGQETAGFDFVPHDETVIVDGEEKTCTYYYYKRVLKAKGTDPRWESTQNVLESVKISPNLSNDGHKNSDYSDVQVDVTIVGETVLADSEDALEQWGKKATIGVDSKGDPEVVWDFN